MFVKCLSITIDNFLEPCTVVNVLCDITLAVVTFVKRTCTMGHSESPDLRP